MLRSFTVSNYRSFRNAEIELKPITILLGRNSSGKSSLTRLVPLLRQSFNRMTSSPVLWTSDVVDFGDVGNVIHHDYAESTIDISLEANPKSLYQFMMMRMPYRATTPSFSLSRLKFTARLSSDQGRTRYHSTLIECDQDCIEIRWGERSIQAVKVNGKEIIDYIPAINIYADTTNFFPAIEYRSDKATPPGYQGVYSGVIRAFEHFLRKKTNVTKRDYLRRSLMYVPRAQMGQYLSTIENVVQSRLDNDHELSRLSEALLVNDFPKIISYFESAVRPVLEASSYLGPSRASGARFYRLQELAVNQIDFRGENLPMYLSSLAPTEMERLNDMLLSATGMGVDIERIAGHVSVRVGHNGNFENLADVGFGYSQLLPIVAQLHASTNPVLGSIHQRYGPLPHSYFLMAIEQPELHLHPAMQANLADLFAASVKNTISSTRGLHLLVETHSESLIARLATLVSRAQISASDVAIYIVEKDEETKTSEVRRASIRNDGTIENWPFGFFSATA